MSKSSKSKMILQIEPATIPCHRGATPDSAATADKEQLRERLLRLIVENEAQRRGQPKPA